VAALAPWLPDGEPTPSLGNRSLLLAHGTVDRITDPAKTTELAEKLAAEGGDVELVKYAGARHSMLFPARPWHDMVARFMVRTLLAPALEAPTGPSGPLRN
jgi:acetyl esterase/lipase